MSVQPLQEMETFLSAFRMIITGARNDLFHLVCPSRIQQTEIVQHTAGKAGPLLKVTKMLYIKGSKSGILTINACQSFC